MIPHLCIAGESLLPIALVLLVLLPPRSPPHPLPPAFLPPANLRGLELYFFCTTTPLKSQPVRASVSCDDCRSTRRFLSIAAALFFPALAPPFEPGQPSRQVTNRQSPFTSQCTSNRNAPGNRTAASARLNPSKSQHFSGYVFSLHARGAIERTCLSSS
jgi:hypothetical protein